MVGTFIQLDENVWPVRPFGGEAQKQWAKDSPHCLVILHEMFLHATSEGWKEAERVVCWGCQQHMPQLDPEVGIPAVQLVHLETDREQLLKLYLEVYKLHRLPGSPPGEPAILEEIFSPSLSSTRGEGHSQCPKTAQPQRLPLTPEQTISMEMGRLNRQKLSQSVQSTLESIVDCGNSGRRDQKVA